MKLTSDEKSTIYSLLSNIKEKMEYINFYYINNFKDLIDWHISENKRNSIIQVNEDDIRNWAIWKLMEILENRVTHNTFISNTFDYYKSLDDLKKWFDCHALIKCEFQNTIETMIAAFSYSYTDDGIGIDDESFETGIIHLHINYSNLHSIIEDFIKEISPIKCKREITFFKLFKRNITQSTISEEEFINQLIESCFKLQEERKYYKDNNNDNNDLENSRNRFIRDILDAKIHGFNYIVKDQTQRGQSENGKAPGEIDFLIETKNTIFTVIEALNLDDSFNKSYLKDHETKLKNQYDKVGNKFNVILVYADVQDFDSFQTKYQKYLNDNYTESLTQYDIDKVNCFGYVVQIKHLYKTQKLYHLVFKIG